MLAQKPESTPAQSEMDPMSATVSPADLNQPIEGDFDFEAMLRTIAQSASAPPETFEPNDYLTSPWTPYLDGFGESPGETPLSEFLGTPVISDQDNAMLSEPLFDDSFVFDAASSEQMSSESDKVPSLDTSGLLSMSPTSPALDPSHLISPAMTMISSFPPAPTPQALASPALSDVSSPASASRRRVSATGTRKNITVDSLVPIDAPTQARRYITPSATSKKELPAVFARKRARQQMLDGEEDELINEPLKPNATELEQIEWKRRQNTLAARKSRKRKLQHQQELENQVNALQQEREKWRQRALTLQGILQANGIPFGDFQD